MISYNPGYQRMLKDLKPSTRQRFVALDFDFPPLEREPRSSRAKAASTMPRRMPWCRSASACVRCTTAAWPKSRARAC